MHIDPKAELAKRSIHNWAVCIVCFLAWAIVVGFILPPPLRLVAYGLGIAVAYYALFHFLEPSPLLITCPNCNKQISTNTPWRCGLCKAENRRADEVPFTQACSECGATPKAYRCHHSLENTPCGNLIYLSPDEQVENYACCLTPEPKAAPVVVPPTSSEVRLEAQAEARHKIEMARLSAVLEQRLKLAGPKVEKSSKERLNEDFQNDYDAWLGAEEEAEKQRVLARERFKDNKVLLKKALDLINAWAQKHAP